MPSTQEHRTWNGSWPAAVASSWFIALGRPGVIASLSFMMAVASCSKQEKDKAEEKPRLQADAPAVVPAAAEPPKPEEAKKAPPVVTPSHLPPNPRLVLAQDRQGVSAGGRPQPVQARPAATEAAANVRSSSPMPTTDVHTPEQSRQARLQALEAMFRQRDDKSRAAHPGGNSSASPAVNQSTEKNVSTKN